MVFPVFFVFWTLLLPLLVESTPGSQELFPTDCSDVYVNGHTLSGVYTIYPTADTPVQVYCDMGCQGRLTEDGKWMVFQRRMDGSVNFYRPWEQYKKGFGNKYGEYWLDEELQHRSLMGLENLYQLTRKRNYELKVDLQDFDGASVYARYSSFSVDSEANRWYNRCHNTNPNGIYLWGRDDSHYAIGNVWQHWKGYDYGLKYIAMKFRPVAQ